MKELLSCRLFMLLQIKGPVNPQMAMIKTRIVKRPPTTVKYHQRWPWQNRRGPRHELWEINSIFSIDRQLSTLTQNMTFAWFTLIYLTGHPVVLSCEALSGNLRGNREQVLPTPVRNSPQDQPRPSHMSIYIPLDDSENVNGSRLAIRET